MPGPALQYPRDFVTEALDDIPAIASDPFGSGQWLKVKTLGEAIFGKVLSAELPEDGQGHRGLELPESFAVKIMPREDAFGPGRGLENPRNEIRAALMIKGLNLEYVTKVYGVWQDERSIYIATELCRHDALTEVMHGPKKTVAQCAELVRQMLTGLRGLHHAGIVHRDVSLENCLVARDGSIRLIDFGQAALVHDPGAHDEALMVVDRRGPPGKHCLMTPEVMRALVNRAITNFQYSAKKLDMYQLGVAAFAIMAQSYPYNPKDMTVNPPKGKMTLVALNKIVGEEGFLFRPCDDANDRCCRLGKLLDDWDCRDQVPDLCFDFLERVMAPNPTLRFSVDQALEHPWISPPQDGAAAFSAGTPD